MATRKPVSKTESASKTSSAAKAAPAVKTTPARNTPIPKVETLKAAAPAAPLSTPAPLVITNEMIATRAFEISLGSSNDELGNWLQAERELKGL